MKYDEILRSWTCSDTFNQFINCWLIYSQVTTPILILHVLDSSTNIPTSFKRNIGQPFGCVSCLSLYKKQDKIMIQGALFLLFRYAFNIDMIFNRYNINPIGLGIGLILNLPYRNTIANIKEKIYRQNLRLHIGYTVSIISKQPYSYYIMQYYG